MANDDWEEQNNPFSEKANLIETSEPSTFSECISSVRLFCVSESNVILIPIFCSSAHVYT